MGMCAAFVQGEGAYGRVYRGLRGGVQDVAVKQLLHTGDGQMGEFVKVMRLRGLRGGSNHRTQTNIYCPELMLCRSTAPCQQIGRDGLS